MTQSLAKGITELTEEAYKVVKDISVDLAKKRYRDGQYVFVDVREADERRQHGVIPQAFTCPRGMLEFLIDPQFPAYNPVFGQDKTYVFYCSGGLRSLYAAQKAHEMGLPSVMNLAGGFDKWTEMNGEIELAKQN